MPTSDPQATVLAFLSAIEEEATPEELAAFLHPDVRQLEYPSLVKPFTAERGRTDILAGSVKGRDLLASQHYDVHDVLALGDRVVLQLRWVGVLAADLGDLKAGHRLQAQVAMFVTVQNGLITHQASYDCYESFNSVPADAMTEPQTGSSHHRTAAETGPQHERHPG